MSHWVQEKHTLILSGLVWVQCTFLDATYLSKPTWCNSCPLQRSNGKRLNKVMQKWFVEMTKSASHKNLKILLLVAVLHKAGCVMWFCTYSFSYIWEASNYPAWMLQWYHCLTIKPWSRWASCYGVWSQQVLVPKTSWSHCFHKMRHQRLVLEVGHLGRRFLEFLLMFYQ